jgi:hypothetical protein
MSDKKDYKYYDDLAKRIDKRMLHFTANKPAHYLRGGAEKATESAEYRNLEFQRNQAMKKAKALRKKK